MNGSIVRLYRVLLRAYPTRFRDRFSEEMCVTFEREMEQRRGPLEKLSLCFLTLFHVLVGAPLEHVAAWSQRARRRSSGHRRLTDGLRLDIRFALRSLRAHPVLSMTVIATLGVGIGGGTAMFGLVNALALRPLPFTDADELLRLRDSIDRPGQATWWYDSSERSFQYVREHATAFVAVTGGNYRQFNVTGSTEPMTVVGSGVAPGWLDVLGVSPVLGRGFSTEEHAHGDAARTVLLGHGLWTTTFGADPDVIGRPLAVDGQLHTIIGVMPRRFNFPYGARLWVPDSFDATETSSGLYVVARRPKSATPQSVSLDLARLTRGAQTAHPESHRGIRFTAVSLREDLVGNRTRVAFALLAAVAVLMLIGCGNVTNLLTVRAASRRREFALRAALGASRWRQMRQLAVETALLTTLGWLAALAFASLFTSSLTTLSVSPSESLGEFFGNITVDARVLGFSIGISGLTAIVAAIAPAIRASRGDVRGAIAGGHALSGGSVRPVLRAVVIGEVTLAFVLLLGADVLMDELRALRQTDLGFETQNRLVVPLAISPVRYGEQEQRLRLVRAIEERVGALPSVRGVGTTQHTPVSLGDWTGPMTFEGGHESTPDDRLLANVRIVTPGYLTALGVPFVAGRTFTPEENRDERNVVIVTDNVARTHWPGRDPIGQRVKFGAIDNDRPWLTVVGVVRDVKEEWNGVEPTWYMPYRQNTVTQMNVIVHHDGDPATLIPAVRRAVADVDLEQATGEITRLANLVTDSFAPERFGALLAGLFAVFGTSLAALGVYGVLSFAVRQRSREIALRIALGSSVPGVMGRVLGGGLAMLGVGAVLALALTPLLGQLATIPWADGDVNQFRLLGDGMSLRWQHFAAVLATLGAATMAASYFPARRAAAVDPAVTLRET